MKNSALTKLRYKNEPLFRLWNLFENKNNHAQRHK